MSDANWYTTVFKSWHKSQGQKPSDELLAQVHNLGLRPGKQALANAMYLRPEGATQGQIIMACGAPQLNRMRGLITDKLVKRVAISPGAEGHTVYKIELTAKGSQRIETAVKREAEATELANGAIDKAVKSAGAAKRASKAKGAVKAPKARVAKGKASKRASDAPSATEAATNPEQATDFAAGNGIELIPDSNGIEYDNPHDE